MSIKESDLFKGVSQRFITKIAKNGEEATFRRNNIIFRAGEPAGRFYVLVEGEVEISLGRREGPRLLVNRPGEIFGWSALVEPYVFTVLQPVQDETQRSLP